MTVKPGLEVLHDSRFRLLDGQRVGLMTNPSAVDRRLRSAYQVFTRSPDVNTVALFGPEHGLMGAAPDAERIASATDPRTSLPVYSLYGDTYRPTADMLRDVDTLVCDIQDIGVRYYTFTWTVSHVLEAAGEHGVRVVVLDRPNPLGGVVMDGPLLEPELASFVGRFPVPVRHGMTLGELAQMINALWNPTPADLTVVRCEGWQRADTWPDTGLPWVAPSPNIPHPDTLDHYPGACLVEGTGLSEGRGTALPFEIVGAPWIDPVALADRLNAETWAARMGAFFCPHSFLPTQSKWQNQYCHGVQVHRVDPACWRPIQVWLGVIMTIRAMYPDRFAWLPQHPDTDHQHFDRLIGSTRVRQIIETSGDTVGGVLDRLTEEWADDCRAFDRQRRPFLLYDRE